MAYSYAKREARGDSKWRMLGHAIYRSVVLVLLGVFLSSGGGTMRNWSFMSVRSQIGLVFWLVFWWMYWRSAFLRI